MTQGLLIRRSRVRVPAGPLETAVISGSASSGQSGESPGVRYNGDTLIGDVAVLYVDPRGPYPKLVEHWYDEARDARTYTGPWPVVAHPPCGPWGDLAHFCTKQDPALGIIAVDQVRRFGGVLEHPAKSRLFRHCGMPLPNELPDRFGGRTVAVDQVSWGHLALKRTWLHLVGLNALHGARSGGTVTHVVATSRGDTGLPEMPKRERHISPVAFAEWLISLAQQVNRKVAS